MATATAKSKKTQKGFKVGCICCGEKDVVSVDLSSMEFSCSNCSETFTTADVKAMISEWRRVIAWVDMAPAAVEDEDEMELDLTADE